MKKTTSILILSFLTISFILAQQNSYESHEINKQSINQQDIIDALKMSGLEIFKFSLGEFSDKYKFSFVLEELTRDSLIQKTVLYEGINIFKYYDNEGKLVEDYISQIRVISKEEENDCLLSIDLPGTKLDRQFAFVKTYNRQFFRWRRFAETNWTLNKKTPLMAYISSWRDETGYIRHCGVRQLKERDKSTNEFFSKSPSYFILSYMIENK